VSIDKVSLDFVTFVITPLRKAAEEGQAEQVLDSLQEIKKFVAALEGECKSRLSTEMKKVKEKPTRASSEPARVEKPFHDNSVSPLDKWLAVARAFTDRQRSLAREIEILRTSVETNGAVMLSPLCERLIKLGLVELGKKEVVVTQISRLKKLGIIRSEAQGLYLRAEGAADRLTNRRNNYNKLFVPDNVRMPLD